MPTDSPRLEEALRWRAVERELRDKGWSRSRAAAEVARLKREEQEKPAGLWPRLLNRIFG